VPRRFVRVLSQLLGEVGARVEGVPKPGAQVLIGPPGEAEHPRMERTAAIDPWSDDVDAIDARTY
jgi:hypothetical protein